MISTITTTHAIPKKLLPARAHSGRTQLIICHHCAQILGSSGDAEERRKLEADHICKEKLHARQPAAALPFS